MANKEIFIKCDLCGNEFQFGPHIYNGHHISLYNITVCKSCWIGNHDGWAPHLEDKVLANLASEGKPFPDRNTKGWYPRS